MDRQVADIRAVLVVDSLVDQQVDILVDTQAEVALEVDFHLQSTYIVVDSCNCLVLTDRTATQHDRLLASSCGPSVCPFVTLYIVALRVGIGLLACS